MLFNSLDFIIFLPVVFLLYYAVRGNWRWMVLLAASYYFYMSWKPEYALLLLFSTGVDFWTGLKMHSILEKKKRRPYLILSLSVNLGLLFFFKYFNFFSINISEFVGLVGTEYRPTYLNLILPLGISFYTFQTMSYSIDIYNDNLEPETHFGYFAVYVSFFPQLIAGPIERSAHLLPQFRKKFQLNLEDVRYGLNKIALGFFKKLVVADSISVFVDYVFIDLSVSNGLQVTTACVLFGLQSFADFSGYTDIAIGAARLCGIRLIDNFNRPFWVKNLRDFWSRWHMSLTQFLFIYMQRPLMGTSRSQWRLFWVNILVLSTVGFWHGATWPYMLFGIGNGLVMGVQTFIEKHPRSPQVNNVVYQKAIRPIWNLVVLAVLLLMYRAQSFGDIVHGYTKIFTEFEWSMQAMLMGFGSTSAFLLLAFNSMLLIPTIWFHKKLEFKSNFVYLMVIFTIIIVFGQDTKQQFLYFQF